MKRILFIEGYDVVGYDDAEQQNVRNLLNKYNVTFFRYQNNDDINSIIKKLEELLCKKYFNAIIAHSTAGAILKIVSNKIHISHKTKIIFTNAIISNKHNTSLKLLELLPENIIKNIKLPRFIRLPLYNLTYGFDNYINNITTVSQYRTDDAAIVGNAIKIMSEYDFDKNTFYHIIYGIDDEVVSYPKELLNELNRYNNIRLYPLKSKHEPFNDSKDVQHAWKKQILKIVN